MFISSTPARIRLINKRHVVDCEWLSDKMLGYAQKVLADLREEEPNAGWKLEVCGELMNWHELGTDS